MRALAKKRRLIWIGVLLVLMGVLGLVVANTQPAAAATATQATVGLNHSCALTDTGGVKCWGLNFDGQLGDGTDTNSSTAVDVLGLTDAAVVSAGGVHTCAVTTAGGVKCWGFNSLGQLGDGTNTDSTTPVNVLGLASSGADVSAGFEFSCALITSGGVKCWGDNGGGQLGDGTTNDSTTPVDVCADAACSSDLSDVVAMAAGSEHACAVTNSGGVKCWGAGNLGDGSTAGSTTPVDVCADAACSSTLSGVVAVSGNNGHTCVLTNSGGVKCWGSNIDGRLGDGTATDSTTPVDVCADAACSSDLSDIAQVSAGAHHTCALTTSGGVKCWGENTHGQLGDGGVAGFSLTPVDVLGLTSGVVNISSPMTGSLHTCAVTSAGEVKCWGNNGSGQLGDGTTDDRNSPVNAPFPLTLAEHDANVLAKLDDLGDKLDTIDGKVDDIDGKVDDILDALDRCEIQISGDEQSLRKQGANFQFFVLTSVHGVRADPTSLSVWVGDTPVAPVGGTPESVVVGVSRVELDKKSVPPSESVTLTVEADISGATCSDIDMIQRGNP